MPMKSVHTVSSAALAFAASMAANRITSGTGWRDVFDMSDRVRADMSAAPQSEDDFLAVIR